MERSRTGSSRGPRGIPRAAWENMKDSQGPGCPDHRTSSATGPARGEGASAHLNHPTQKATAGQLHGANAMHLSSHCGSDKYIRFRVEPLHPMKPRPEQFCLPARPMLQTWLIPTRRSFRAIISPAKSLLPQTQDAWDRPHADGLRTTHVCLQRPRRARFGCHSKNSPISCRIFLRYHGTQASTPKSSHIPHSMQFVCSRDARLQPLANPRPRKPANAKKRQTRKTRPVTFNSSVPPCIGRGKKSPELGLNSHSIQKAEETQRPTGYMGIILKCKRHWSTADLQKDKQKPAVGIVRRERESDG